MAETEKDLIVSKAEFARICGVHRTRPSHWIKDRKIFGAALVGEGRNAKICVREAKAQLRRHLDIGQRFGNAIDTRLEDTAPLLERRADTDDLAEGAPLDRSQFSPLARNDDAIEEQIKRERLEEIKRRNRRMAEEDALRSGRFVLAEDSRREMGKIAGRMMVWIENALPEIAGDVADHFNLPRREVLMRMKSSLRTERQRASIQVAAEAAKLPATQECDLAREEESENGAE